MKDNEFINLLNLYLDHEISPADAARLEAEVQRQPARYRIYREYCRMHKACTLLSVDYATEVPAAAAVGSPSRGWPNPFAIAGLMAAAACVGLVFLQRTPEVQAPSGPAVAEKAVASPSAAGEAMPVVVENTRNIAKTVTVSTLATHTLRLIADEPASEPVHDARLNWIETVQLSSVPQVPADSLRFETKTTLKNVQRSFGSSPFQGAAESAAWQFQR